MNCPNCAPLLEVLNEVLTQVELERGESSLPADLVENIRAVVARAEAQ